jgi:hypothetical protein
MLFWRQAFEMLDIQAEPILALVVYLHADRYWPMLSLPHFTVQVVE